MYWIQYPHLFEENVLEKIKGWVMDENARVSGEECNWKHDMGKKNSSDSEMLKTYSTGLLAVSLTGYALALEIYILPHLS